MDSYDLSGLKDAIEDCKEHKLYFATKWLAELYASLKSVDRERAKVPRHSTTAYFELTGSPSAPPPSKEYALIRVAQGNFDCRKLYKNAHLLRECKSYRGRFLALYSQFLAAEKKAQDIWNGLDGEKNQPPAPVNTSLDEVLANLVEDPPEPFLLFLKGILLSRLNRRGEAREVLLKSVHLQPWNWSAWLQLSLTLESLKDVREAREYLPQHVMTHIFSLKIGIEMHLPTDEDVTNVDRLIQCFPDSAYLQTQKAQLCFQQKDWITAQRIWEQVLKVDPHRIDNVDQYSNMLFVMQKKQTLFKLANDYLAADEARPEVSCLIGNYYSSTGEHHKAIKYLRRAVQLDRYHVMAWTLIGHEYIQVKNFQAAIEAYRRAIDVNKRNFRAWYGLGKAYDNLMMPTYALNYYQRALALYSYDPGLWQAVGTTYIILNKPKEAISCLKRALAAASPDNPTEVDKNLYGKIAHLYDTLGDESGAIECHRQVVAISRRLGKPLEEYSKSCRRIALYHISLLNQAFSPVRLDENAAQNFLIAKQHLQMLIQEDGKGGALNNEEAIAAREMLKTLEIVEDRKLRKREGAIGSKP